MTRQPFKQVKSKFRYSRELRRTLLRKPSQLNCKWIHHSSRSLIRLAINSHHQAPSCWCSSRLVLCNRSPNSTSIWTKFRRASWCKWGRPSEATAMKYRPSITSFTNNSRFSCSSNRCPLARTNKRLKTTECRSVAVSVAHSWATSLHKTKHGKTPLFCGLVTRMGSRSRHTPNRILWLSQPAKFNSKISSSSRTTNRSRLGSRSPVIAQTLKGANSINWSRSGRLKVNTVQLCSIRSRWDPKILNSSQMIKLMDFMSTKIHSRSNYPNICNRNRRMTGLHLLVRITLAHLGRGSTQTSRMTSTLMMWLRATKQTLKS